MNDDNVLSINIAESIGTHDVFGTEKGKTGPEVHLARYVDAHSKVSREVTQDDIGRVLNEAEIMHKLCFTPRGKYPSAVAIAHPQIDDQDPLRFFVTVTGEMIINPSIKDGTKVLVDNYEGCMTYPDADMVKVMRHNVIDLTYQTVLKDGTLSEMMEKTLSGKTAKFIQHEIAHLDAKYIIGKPVDIL